MTIENRCTFSKDVLVLKHFEILDGNGIIICGES